MPEKVQVAIIGSALVIIGAATEAAVSWIAVVGKAAESAPGV